MMTFFGQRLLPSLLATTLGLLLVLPPLQAAAAEAPNHIASVRPFHHGLIKINPDLDTAKPLAMADYAGVAVESGVLIASYDEDWVAGFRLPHMQPLWWLPSKGGLTAPPAIFGSWAVVGMRDGQLYKVNLTSGEVLWRANLDSFASRSIRKSGSHLLVTTASQSLYNIDFQTGAVRWIYDGGYPEGITIRNTAAPVVHEQNVYLGLANGDVAAIALDSGKLVWRHNPSFSSARFQDVVGEMIILDRRLLVTRYDGIIASISLDHPRQAPAGWEEPRKVNTITASAYRQGKLYIGTSNGYVYGFNAQNGRENWRVLIGESLSSITAGESQLYTAATSGRISTLDATSGQLVWHDHLQGQVVSAPVYIGKDLFFLTGSKVLYGYKI